VRAKPPVHAVQAALRAEAAFILEDQAGDTPAVVRLARPLRPEQVYRSVVTALIEVIRTAPGQGLEPRGCS
jgi:hypothetical protein